MHRYLKIIAGALSYVTFSIASAGTIYQQERQHFTTAANTNYTVLDSNAYAHTVQTSRREVSHILQAIQPYRRLPTNVQLALIVHSLSDRPYLYSGAMGEGDWPPDAQTYQAGAVHIDQNPVYRLDGFDCQTFVQVGMALLYAHNLTQFDKTYVQITYGAAGNPQGERIHYFNRNNFIDGDFNPLNEQHGWLSDATATADAQSINADITRQNWFLKQVQNPGDTIAVFNANNGDAMVKRLTTVYTHLNYPNFSSEKITMNYLPKEKIVLRDAQGELHANEELLAKINTPAVAEIIRDPKKWLLQGKPIQSVIGTELTVSHLGFLYRQNFAEGELIYHKITCALNSENKKICTVTPVTCHQLQCHKLMFAHATDAYPDGYYWYQQADKNFACTEALPRGQKHFTRCNRVVAVPLADYVSHYMETASIMGIHVEKLN